jgi:hypothetical protein
MEGGAAFTSSPVVSAAAELGCSLKKNKKRVVLASFGVIAAANLETEHGVSGS